MSDLHVFPGDRIEHTTLGVGTVIAAHEGGWLGDRVVIRFDQGGEKELLWAFAGGKVTVISRATDDRFNLRGQDAMDSVRPVHGTPEEIGLMAQSRRDRVAERRAELLAARRRKDTP